MALLTIASLLIVPALIKADGGAAWGSIALGQSLGTIGSVVVAYGWQTSGPALVAMGDTRTRRTVFFDSVRLRLALYLPVAAASGALAAGFAHQRTDLAVAGAVTTVGIGLTSGWFFVGMAQPSGLLWFETVPRVTGTAAGIGWMYAGGSALEGLLCQFGGMLLAAAVSCVAVHRATRSGSPATRSTLRQVARAHRHGLGATVTTNVSAAAPLVLVSLIAPSLQPAYALIDKLQRQITVGLTPLNSLLQGWVPRGPTPFARIASASKLIASMAVPLLGGVTVAMPFLVRWLGNSQISVSPWVYPLAGSIVALAFTQLCLSNAVLSTLQRLDTVSRATAVGAVVGLPLTALGATISIEATLGGVVAGLVVRVTMSSIAVRRELRRNALRAEAAATPERIPQP
ncbi:hypothetical protein [Nocardioides aurantiacus]|nr:hypothetical protein [Nocardioides aurantiacus]